MQLHTIRISLAGLITLTFLACSPPRVDRSSDIAFQNSVSEVRDALPEDEQDEFDVSLVTILNYKSAELRQISSFIESGLDPANFEEFPGLLQVNQTRIHGFLHDKTAEEILARAQSIIAELEIEELHRLTRQFEANEEALATLQKIAPEELRLEISRISTTTLIWLHGSVKHSLQAPLSSFRIKLTLEDSDGSSALGQVRIGRLDAPANEPTSFQALVIGDEFSLVPFMEQPKIVDYQVVGATLDGDDDSYNFIQRNSLKEYELGRLAALRERHPNEPTPTSPPLSLP